MMDRTRRLATLAVLAAVVASPALGQGTSPEILTVTSAADDGAPGTLRWAIERNNAAPGRYRIVLQPPADGKLVIRPKTLLPTIVGPTRIEGPWYGGTHSADVVLDGADLFDLSVMAEPGAAKACPGQDRGYGPNVRSLHNPGLAVVDSRKVEITGFEIRNFCIGVLSLRSRETSIHHMRFENNLGAGAIILTGDDGKPADPTTGNIAPGSSGDNLVEYNLLINNSDAIDVARGDANSRIRFNTMIIDGTGLAVPSSGIETNNKVSNVLIEGNYLSGFAEALQIMADNAVVVGNELTGNVTALGVMAKSGRFERNIIHANRVGVGLRAAATGNTISRNSIYDNGADFSTCAPGGSTGGVCFDNNWETSRHSLTLNYPRGRAPVDDGSKCPDRLPDCNGGQNAPAITRAAWAMGGVFAEGALKSRPDQTFALEFFVSRTAGPDGGGEGEEFIGGLKVRTDAKGQAQVRLPPTAALRSGGFLGGEKTVFLTVTATNLDTGTTSEFSKPVAIRLP